MEQRAAQHQERLAEEVVAEATKQIMEWRSAYGGEDLTLSKGQAVGYLNVALRHVLASRSPSLHPRVRTDG